MTRLVAAAGTVSRLKKVEVRGLHSLEVLSKLLAWNSVGPSNITGSVILLPFVRSISPRSVRSNRMSELPADWLWISTAIVFSPSINRDEGMGYSK